MASNVNHSQAPEDFLHFVSEKACFEVVRSQKGKLQVYHDGHFHNFDKATKAGLAWRCCRKGCKGRIVTEVNWREQTEPPRVITEHVAHPVEPELIKAKVRHEFLFFKYYMMKSINFF
jgi:hypothetical protein